MARSSSFTKGLLMAIAVTACSDQSGPTAPAQEVSSDLTLVPGTTVSALARVGAFAGGSAAATIGEAGGSISAGGVTLRVPAGALNKDTYISMTVPAGSYLEVDFQPHGLKFKAPVTVEFSLRGTMAEVTPGMLGSLSAAYFEGSLDTKGKTKAAELFNVSVSGTRLSFQTTHFSGYCVVTGRDCQCD